MCNHTILDFSPFQGLLRDRAEPTIFVLGQPPRDRLFSLVIGLPAVSIAYLDSQQDY